MDLKTFVRETLLELDAGLQEASKTLNTQKYEIGKNASKNNSIDFDIQVYASEGTSTGGKIETGINVVGIKLGAGTQGETNKDSQEYSRISFSVEKTNTDDKNHEIANATGKALL